MLRRSSTTPLRERRVAGVAVPAGARAERTPLATRQLTAPLTSFESSGRATAVGSDVVEALVVDVRGGREPGGAALDHPAPDRLLELPWNARGPRPCSRAGDAAGSGRRVRDGVATGAAGDQRDPGCRTGREEPASVERFSHAAESFTSPGAIVSDLNR